MAEAIRWIKDHASEYGYREEVLFLDGFSSGAHLAALICTNEKYLQEVGLQLQDIKGLIPISGTYDIADYHRVFANGARPEMAQTHVEAIFGSPDKFAEASPILLISDNNLTITPNYLKIK